MATPELLQRYPGAHYVQTKEQNRMIPKVILILKRVSLTVRLQTLASFDAYDSSVQAVFAIQFRKNTITFCRGVAANL